MLTHRTLRIFLFLFLLSLSSTIYADDKARIITQKALINGEQLINCENLARFLNSAQKKFQFQCEYLSDKEIINLTPQSNDLFILGPPLFLMLKERLNKKGLSIIPLFNISKHGFGWNGYQGAVIFTKRASPINRLADLKGKRVGCVGELAGSVLLFQYELYKLNIPEEKIKFEYFGNWKKVVEAVLEDNVDAGVVRTGILEHLNKTGKVDLSNIKILNQKSYSDFPYLVSSDLIPDWYVAYSHYTNPSMIFTILENLYPYIIKNEKIPNTDLIFLQPNDPKIVNDIQRTLLKGPFAYLKTEIKKKQITVAIVITLVSLIITSILTFLLIKLYKLNQVKKGLLIELQELNLTLEKQVEEKTANLINALKDAQRESQKFHTVFSSLDLGLCIIDEEGKILDINSYALNLFDGENLYGVNICEILKLKKELLDECFKKVNNEGYAEFETTFYKKDGTELILYVKILSLDDHLKLIAIVDLTTQKKLFEESLRATQLETLRVLSSGLAHDLNNLLSAITNNIDLLLIKKALPEEAKRTYLERIKSLSFRAKVLTQELLVLGKGLVLNPVAEKLPDLLTELVEFILSGSGIIPNYSFDPNANFVKVDKNYLSIALTNIILNARQAMQDKGMLYVNTKALDDEVLIAIRDTGPGIPEEIKDRLFQPFTTTKPGGSGLGLYSTKRIVEAHGGRIEIESERGKGTTVKLYLPLLSPEEAHMEEEKIKPQKEVEKGLRIVKRILLLDDEAEVRESLVEILSELGCEVIGCENGEETIKVYQEKGPFDLVILDYTVPGKWNGIEVFRELKKVDPKIEAILATGYAQADTVILAKQEGFKDVLLKPFTLEDLLRVLK